MYKLFFILTAMTGSCVAEEVDYALIEKGLKEYAAKVKTLKQNIDNSVFNDSEILLELEFETEQIIAFVQNKIAFQPYQGLLRGVQGTLNSRAGNALDQSVLLAKLLNDAGLEARVATGKLSDPLTLQLLSGMAQAEIPQHIGQGGAFEAALKSLTTQPQNHIDWSNTKTYSRYQTSKNHLTQVLNEQKIGLKNKDVTNHLIAQNNTYFWVQYRMSPTESWQTAHPAFTQTEKKPLKPEPEVVSHFKDTVPEQYLHQLKVEAFIEQRVGDKTKQHSLMKPWIKPVANLQNQLITFSNAPSAVSFDTAYDLTGILNKSSFFAPTFNGRKVGGKVFDLNGRWVDAAAASAPAGALFKTVGDKTMSAVDKLSAIGGDQESKQKSSQPLMQLNSQWLKFTFIYPDGTEYVQKRYIYQAADDKTIDELKVKTQLMTEYALLVNSGEKPNAYLAKVYLDLVASGLPLLKSAAKKVFSPDDKVGFPKTMPQNEFELLAQYHWMQQNPEKNTHVIQYRSVASLLGFKRGYLDPETAFLAVDVVANKQTFLQQQDNKFYTNLEAAIIQGVWETASEWIPSQVMGLSGNSVDTLKVVEASVKQSIAFEVIQSAVDDKAALKKISGANSALFDRLMADLNQGYVIAVPAKKPDDLLMIGWWRINPETGETLGMTADGGGQSSIEYTIDFIDAELTAIRGVEKLKECRLTPGLNTYEKVCCLTEAHINNIHGMAFSGALSGTLGTIVASVYSIVDFTADAVTGSGIGPSTNGDFCKALGPASDF